ncbi:putative amastin [Trypanosoma rangeli]|uniref:Putative amastin n=1 Tax=Trypanosoma rangeli TaxID=5698 RepID=A0A422MQR2_TRYRA|nr:putative amastin [Trypanosoma rangeli]RNE95533.1 putative amastin [Trypanosoma rangeli]|eukprot:RNE95533.1 putative amastin [Trypanosoma rangeli]
MSGPAALAAAAVQGGEWPDEARERWFPQPHVGGGRELHAVTSDYDRYVGATGNTPQTVGQHVAGPAVVPSSNHNTAGGQRGNTLGLVAHCMHTVGVLTSHLGGTTFLSIFLAVCVANWLFVILAMLLFELDMTDNGCYTFWGNMDDCGTMSYSNRTQFSACNDLRLRLNMGGAFSAIFAFFNAVVIFLIFRALVDHHEESRERRSAEASSREEEHGQQQSRDVVVSSNSKMWTTLFLVAALASEVVFCVVSVIVYNFHHCEKALPRTTTYLVGLGLLVAGWTAGVIALVLFLVVM